MSDPAVAIAELCTESDAVKFDTQPCQEKADTLSPASQAAETLKESQELKALKQHHAQIKKWINDVNKRIYTVETNYLEDTHLGNIVKGWELDRATRVRGQIDDKDRLFSYSSYEVLLNKRTQRGSSNSGEKKQPSESVGFGHKQKKAKKRKIGFDDISNDDGDY